MSSLTQMIEKKIVEMESVGYYRSPKYSSLISLSGKSMYGAVRVLVFFVGIVLMPCILLITPLYLRHKIFSDVAYAVTESDVLNIKDGISSFFCQAQTIKMNTSFNAFQIDGHQVDTSHKKHFRLRKSMSLPDDSLEYWGFFLNKGSVVNLTLCSRHEGGRIMVVKDIRDFHSCGLLERARKIGVDPHVNVRKNEVHIIYDPNAEVVKPSRNSNENEGENFSQENLDELKKYAEIYMRKKIKRMKPFPITEETSSKPRATRSVNDKAVTHMEGFLHGKTNNESSDSSVSSFENTLITCHEGRILLNNNFTSSHHCVGFDFLENRTPTQIQHEVQADGYYFYIFYSDNDIIINDIHAIFNIFKPTYEYSDYIRGCINQTECTFPITFLSNEKVVVEIPMKNGIEHESEEVEILISKCQPRTLVYAVFPIAVLILILAFSFI